VSNPNDKVIVRSNKLPPHTGPFPHKNTGKIARTDNEQIKRLKTFKNVKFIEDAWPTKYAAKPDVRQMTSEPYMGKKNHTTEIQ